MRVILDFYDKSNDPDRPLVCFDEQSVQLLGNQRPELAVRPGKPRRRDYEYSRCGTRNLFIFVTPKQGLRTILVTQRRTKLEFAKSMRYLVDVIHPKATCIDVILDNLNTHTTDTVIEIFGMPEAARILDRLSFHYTPLHASWLNLAENELSVLTRQCLSRRIDSEWMLASEIVAWELLRNFEAIPIRWSFTWHRAKRLFAKMPAIPVSVTSQN
jgi:DDE superfamily endonuclease